MDTAAVVAAMRSPAGASAALLRSVQAGRASLLATVPLCIEYASVCCRPEHVLASGLSAQEVEIFLDAVVALVEPVNVWFLWRPQLHDAGDELVLEAVVNARADALVTFNRRDFQQGAARFGFEILLPSEAIRRIRA